MKVINNKTKLSLKLNKVILDQDLNNEQKNKKIKYNLDYNNIKILKNKSKKISMKFMNY